MRLRYWIVLLALTVLFPNLARGQTDFSVSTLTAVGTGCTLQNTSDHVVIYTTGTGSATFTVQGVFTGTISFFGSGDGGTSFGPLGVTPSSGGAAVQTTTVVGLWQVNTAAYTHVCMMFTAYTSGTVFAKIHTSPISARTGGSGGGGGGMVPPGSTGITSLTTMNTSGAATYSSATGVLNIPNYVGVTSLDAITSAVSSPAALTNAAFNIPWNWQLTGAGSGLTIGETAASTGATIANPGFSNQSILQVQTASNSTASPLAINQGAQTNTVAAPALGISTTWNNAALSGQGLVIQANCLSCVAASSYPLSILNGVNANLLSLNNNGALTINGNFANNTTNGTVTTFRVVSGNYQSSTNAATAIYTGGADFGTTSALGAGIFKGGDNSNGTGQSGLALLRGGVGTGGVSGAGMEGVTEIASGYLGTGVAATGDIVCSTAVQWQITDCPTGQANIIGVANSITNPYIIVTYGTVPVRLTAAGTLGHTVCLSATTAGQATDSGGTAACATAGAQIGVIVATGGNVVVGSGATAATVALSTTLPLVQLHIR